MYNPNQYKINGLQSADEALLHSDVYLIILYATRIPPHLAVSVNGKIFTLTVKGPSVDGNLSAMLKFIRQKSVASIFVKLQVPLLMTTENILEEIRKYINVYPRVDVHLATCLSPIKDFCSSVYHIDTNNVNFIYELMPKLYEQKIIQECYQLNLDREMMENSFSIEKYSMNDIYEGIRRMRTLIEA